MEAVVELYSASLAVLFRPTTRMNSSADAGEHAVLCIRVLNARRSSDAVCLCTVSKNDD